MTHSLLSKKSKLLKVITFKDNQKESQTKAIKNSCKLNYHKKTKNLQITNNNKESDKA